MNRRPIIALIPIAAVVLAASLSGCSIVSQAKDILNGSGSDSRPDVEPTSEAADASAFAIHPGDCVNDIDLEDEFDTIPIVGCDLPHDSEVYASVLMDDGEFPGQDAIDVKAEADCAAEFATFAGIDAATSYYQYSYYSPTFDSWNNLDDREILCIVYDPNAQTTGSLAGIAH